MMTLMGIVWGLVAIFLVLVASVRPKTSELSAFELKRRASQGQKSAQDALRREELLPDVISLQRVIVALLLVLLVVLSVAVFGWVVGVIIGLIAALEYAAIARLPILHRLATGQYEKFEKSLLHFVKKASPALRIIRSAVPDARMASLHSREELEHLVEEAGGHVLTNHERILIANSLSFDKRLVREVMTPRSVIDSISSKEHLGPLVLNDLHNTGHSRFPVIDGDIDHVIGILHIRDLLTIDAKRKSTSVTKAMEPRVFYINQDQSLQHALAAFLKTHHHLFVVVNEFRETVGILSLEDTLEALIGRRIVDEFDAHEDLRVVAGRNPRGNNHTEKSTDV